MRISFDIDGVLDTERGMELARRLINRGEVVFIIAARNERFSREVYKIAEALNIPRLLVYFNNREQIEKINLNTKAEGVLFEL
jgi:CO dehydrogenase nickel-insertion accessory protein CooC1